MEINEEQYRKIQDLLPKQRGHVKIANLTVLNVPVYRCENGCKWRALPERFGHRHVIYMRLNRWAKSGVLDRVFSVLQAEGLIGLEVLSLDSTAVKVHPDAHRASKKNGKQAIGKSRGGWNTKINALVAGTESLWGSVYRPGTRLTRAGAALIGEDRPA
jgi:transposase